MYILVSQIVWVQILELSLINQVHEYKLSRYCRVQLFVSLWSKAHQAPLPMGFSKQEYWSGLPCPPLGDLPNLGIEPESPASPAFQADSLQPSRWGSPLTK